jgi:RNA polymerase sigma-70 factor (ECF subfamily)
MTSPSPTFDGDRHGDGPTVAELLELARHGDPQKREELFNVCRDYLNGLARNQLERWMQGKVDASDIVQQTLLEAYRDFDKFQGASEGEWVAWLRCILERNATDFIRHYRGTAKRDVKREVALAHPADGSSVLSAAEPAARDASPSQEFLRRDEELRIAAALEHLTPDHRQVIELRNLQRLPFDEVAARMGRTRPAAQMLWMRAIKKLQQVMGQ